MFWWLMASPEVPCKRAALIEVAKANTKAQLDQDTVTSLTVEPATAESLLAVCSVLASDVGRQFRDCDMSHDLLHHRARDGRDVTLAQVRSDEPGPNTWENAVYVQ